MVRKTRRLSRKENYHKKFDKFDKSSINQISTLRQIIEKTQETPIRQRTKIVFSQHQREPLSQTVRRREGKRATFSGSRRVLKKGENLKKRYQEAG